MIGDFFDDAIDLTSSIVDTTLNSSVNTITNTLDLIDGLTEGEIREKAILELGKEAVSNMTQSQLIDYFENK